MKKNLMAIVAAVLVGLIPAGAQAATSGMATTWSHGIINNYLRSTSYAAFTNVYVGLGIGSVPSTNAGAQTALATQECPPSATSYQRAVVASGVGAWNAPSVGATANTGSITFPAPTGNWCSGATYCTWFFIADVQCTNATTCANGNILVWGQLTAQKNVNSGDAAPSFAGGALTITIASVEDYLNYQDLVAAIPALRALDVQFGAEFISANELYSNLMHIGG